MRFLSRKGKKTPDDTTTAEPTRNSSDSNFLLSRSGGRRSSTQEENGTCGSTNVNASFDIGRNSLSRNSFSSNNVRNNGSSSQLTRNGGSNASFDRGSLGSTSSSSTSRSNFRNASFDRNSLGGGRSSVGNASFDRSSLSSRRIGGNNASFDRASFTGRNSGKSALGGGNAGIAGTGFKTDKHNKQKTSSSGGSKTVNGNIYKVQIPASTIPGQEFQVKIQSRVVKIKCPANARPGQYLQITVPEEQQNQNQNQHQHQHQQHHQHHQHQQQVGNSSDSKMQMNKEEHDDSWHVERINKNNQPGGSNVVMIKIPLNTMPGESFPVRIGGVGLAVTCPAGAVPGMQVKITLPPKDPQKGTNGGNNRNNNNNNSSMNSMSSMMDSKESSSIRSRLSLSRPTRPGDSGESFLVVVPEGVRPGNPFTLSVDGMRFTVTCPQNACGGKRIRFHLPPRYCQQLRQRRSTSGLNSTGSLGSLGSLNSLNSLNNLNSSENLRGRRDDHHKRESLIETFRLQYDVEGWTRTLMLTSGGGKFQWTRVHSTDANNTPDTKPSPSSADNQHDSISKPLHKNAHVRAITEDEVLLLPASQALIDSTVLSLTATPTVLASCTDIIRFQSKKLAQKISWFQSICAQLYRPPQSSHHHLNNSFNNHSESVHLSIRREHLLQDSMTAVLSMDPPDLHRTWRIHFHNEEGIDAGGLTREWFHLISSTLLDVSNGYWCTAKGGGNQMHLQIHPNYKLLGGDGEYKFYFRFLGRVMGKALVTSQLLSDGHFVPYLYKMMLGWPITFSDLQPLDLEYYNSLIVLVDMMDQADDTDEADELLANAFLDFTVTEDVMGEINVVELKPNGANIDVTRDNMLEFMELVLKYRLVTRVEEPLRAMLLGFHDIIPQSLLTIFDFQELELMLCGMPNINVDDWFANTEYSGLYDLSSTPGGKIHTVCMWFWTVVNEMNDERRARLLQFVTGTSGVPAKGFGVLQGSDGDIRRFSIHSVTLEECIYPRAHTCFNRIDLPVYQSREDLKERLETAITLVSTGFDLE